jgi:tripartite-type tricarboxylate transporter receptor subunit TctC
MPMFKSLVACSAIALLALANHSASSQGRTIKVIVPMASGGAGDFAARVLAEYAGRAQGQTIVVETRPGAGTVVGTELASRAAPDGNTLLITAAGNLLISPQLRKLNYDPLTSFVPICMLVSIPDVVAVNSASPFRTLADLISAARAKPGGVTVASLGPATDLQIEFEQLKRAANVNMTFVPYPGVAPAVNAVLGEHVTSVITSYASAAEQLKAGGLRALAATTTTRIEALPEIPTIAEAGYGNYEAFDVWFGLFAPAKTPRETISQLADLFTAALQSPEVKAKLVSQGLYPAAMCGEDFAVVVHKQYDYFGRVIRQANITAE